VNQWLGPDNGLGIVASMGTLWIMDMKEEFAKGREWIKNNLHFDKIDHKINVVVAIALFCAEYLAPLLSCYALTGDDLFLEKAKLVAKALEPAHRTRTGEPF